MTPEMDFIAMSRDIPYYTEFKTYRQFVQYPPRSAICLWSCNKPCGVTSIILHLSVHAEAEDGLWYCSARS